MIVLDEKTIQSMYKMDKAVADLKHLLKAKVEELVENPLRTVIEFKKHEASVLYMPSADLDKELMAMKAVTIFPHNPASGGKTTQGVTLVSDAKTGEHVSLVNASYLTRLRTGALSAIATDLYALKNAEVLTCIGTGGMAFEQVLGVLEVRDIKTINLVNRTKANAEKFKEKLVEFGVPSTITIEVIDEENKSEVVKQSQIINCCTRSETPVFDGKDIQLGTHVNGVGSYLPHMREVDHTFIYRADKIIVDDFHGATEEAGELIHANTQKDWSYDAIHGELKDAYVGNITARENNQEITFFKCVGAAYFDLAVAIGVYQTAKQQNLGQYVTI